MNAYHPKKRLGQHFLTDSEIIKRLIESIAPKKTDRILEIGPGRGVLTVPLAASGAEILAVEFDEDLIKALSKKLSAYKNVKILCADFLWYEPDAAFWKSFVLVGNLPYNITSPVIDWCVRYRAFIERACFMVQKEIARRLAAEPGQKDWSPLSILSQVFFDIELLFEVPPTSFKPPPKVDSAFIVLTPRQKYVVDDFGKFEKVIRASFAKRRKLLLNNLVGEIIPDARQAGEILETLRFKTNCRAEELSIAQFLKLTATLAAYNLL
ncbi:MAG: 16S rRNA (adenine(1518)-N(6)/adenine(1519)-N(6))-dimethyltransferase RsmA [Candidatus Zixiibacteriota bacterium]